MDNNIEIIKSLSAPIKSACRLIEALLGKPFEVSGEILTDQLRYWQWLNRVRIAEKVEVKLEEEGVSRRILTPDYLLPLLRDCGDVSDETLQSAWANMLVSAIASPEAEHVAFVNVLKDLTPLDVQAMDALIHHGYIRRDQRPGVIAGILKTDSTLIELSFSNYYRLGFFGPSGRGLRKFAVLFLKACIRDNEAIEKYIESEDKGGHMLMD